jgi:hypothetical protein
LWRSADGAAAAKEAKRNVVAAFIARDTEKEDLLVKMKLKNTTTGTYTLMRLQFIYGD